MQKSNIVKDSIVYNTLLDGWVRHANYALADRLVEEMGRDIPPSNFTLGILMKMYGKHWLVQDRPRDGHVARDACRGPQDEHHRVQFCH